jgi:3-phosphoshikimate 1-carboxyvinyltransferase
MAMAFAPLALKTDLEILNPEVVSKSFPDFWEKMKVLGIQ